MRVFKRLIVPGSRDSERIIPIGVLEFKRETRDQMFLLDLNTGTIDVYSKNFYVFEELSVTEVEEFLNGFCTGSVSDEYARFVNNYDTQLRILESIRALTEDMTKSLPVPDENDHNFKIFINNRKIRQTIRETNKLKMLLKNSVARSKFAFRNTKNIEDDECEIEVDEDFVHDIEEDL